MNVMDQLPQGEPLRLLRELEQVGREIKSSQTLGSTSVATDRVFSASVYDALTPGSGTPKIEVEFIPDDLTFGGAFCYQLYAVDVTNPLSHSLITTVQRLRVTDDRQRWIVSVSTSREVKFYFLTAGSGTFTTNLV